MMVHSETDAPQPRAVVAGAAGGFIGKELRFLGKEAHAGGAPWEGVNALNAASPSRPSMPTVRLSATRTMCVHPIITKGGDLVNTVPADVRMESYVRAASVQAMRTANAKVNRAARGAAYAVGARVEIDDMPGYLPLAQNAALSTVRGQRPGLRTRACRGTRSALLRQHGYGRRVLPAACYPADGERLFRRGAQQGLCRRR